MNKNKIKVYLWMCVCVLESNTLLWSYFLQCCFTGASWHRHSDTLCWEDHLEHHGQVTHGWKGHSPCGATHVPTLAGTIDWAHDDMDPEKAESGWYEAVFRKKCEILTFNTKKSKTVGLVLPPITIIRNIVCLIVWEWYIKIIFLRYRDHLDRLLMYSE